MTKSTRILFAIDNFTYGGIQTQALSLAKAYQKRGAKIYFLYTTKYEAGFVQKELLDNNFKLINGRFIRDRFWQNHSRHIQRYLPLLKMIMLLRRHRIHYVIPYQNSLSYFFGAIHPYTGAKTTLFHIRNTVLEREPKQKWHFKQAMKNNLPIVTNSNHARIRFKEIYNDIYDLDIRTIYNGLNIRTVDTSMNWVRHFNVESVDFVVSVISNFFKGKDFITVFKAWAYFIAQSNSNAKLLIAGDEGIKGFRAAYENKVKELGIEDSVVFLGRTRHNIELLSVIDCNILSTDNEGLPNSVIETLAMGKPFVGTKVDGVKEVLGDAYPIPLFEKGDYLQLAEILLNIYNEVFDLQEIRDYSLKRFRLFSVEQLIENYSTIIKT